MSEQRLVDTFGDGAGTDTMTKGMLKEAYQNRQQLFYEVMEWSGQLENLEDKSNKVIEEVYKLNK